MALISLNKNQQEAAKHFEGPMLVLAGPGSGKTTVITHRIKNLIEKHDVAPKHIAVISFTKAAAKEMKTKYKMICPKNHGVNFGTFHSFFFKIICSYFGYTLENILSEVDKKEMIKAIGLKNKFFPVYDDELFQNVLTEISLVKNEIIDIECFNSQHICAQNFVDLYKTYETEKGKINKIDFDDMLVLCHELLSRNKAVLDTWRNKIKFILIDEFQDINCVQYQSIRLLSHPINNLFIVGDDDQSIYKFRGARPEFMIRFPDDFPDTKKIVLDINYRSTEEILSLSGRVISHNTGRYEKNIKSALGKGQKPIIIRSEDISAEAYNISKKILEISKTTPISDISVIYRTNIQGRAFIDAFLEMNIPFTIKDTFPSIYTHWINQDICAYLKLSLKPYLVQEAERIINKPKRYISKIKIEQAKRLGESLISGLYIGGVLESWQILRIEELMFYLEAIKSRQTYDAIKYIRFAVGYEEYIKEYAEYRKISPAVMIDTLNELQEASKNHADKEEYVSFSKNFKQERKNEENGVTLTTMHSAKGLEYDSVFIAGCVEGIMPHEKSRTQSYIEEERRLFYVAMTRAKKNLYLSLVKSRYDKETLPTRFLGLNK